MKVCCSKLSKLLSILQIQIYIVFPYIQTTLHGLCIYLQYNNGETLQTVLMIVYAKMNGTCSAYTPTSFPTAVGE